MTNFHDNKDWNNPLQMFLRSQNRLYDQLPWQQGLKQWFSVQDNETAFTLWPTSMTTRIETCWRANGYAIAVSSLWPTSMTTRIETSEYLLAFPSRRLTLCPTSMTTRIETPKGPERINIRFPFMTNFHDNKDWNPQPDIKDEIANQSLWPTSMTTRIETARENSGRKGEKVTLWPTSMTTRIETKKNVLTFISR